MTHHWDEQPGISILVDDDRGAITIAHDQQHLGDESTYYLLDATAFGDGSGGQAKCATLLEAKAAAEAIAGAVTPSS